MLAAKDLTSLDHAIVAGRSSGATIAGYLRITLSSNLGNVIAMLTAGLLLPFLPMLPSQVLVQNLCFDAAQLAFAYDRPRAGALRRPLKLRPREVLASVTGFGVLNAAADLATFAVLVWAVSGTRAEPAFHAGWFTENLLTQALVMVLLRTGRGGGIPVTAGLLALTGLLLPLSPLGPLIGMAALPLAYYPLLALVLALYAARALLVRPARPRRRRAAPPLPLGGRLGLSAKATSLPRRRRLRRIGPCQREPPHRGVTPGASSTPPISSRTYDSAAMNRRPSCAPTWSTTG